MRVLNEDLTADLNVVVLPGNVVEDGDVAGVDDVCVGAGERGVEAHQVGGVVVAERAKVVGVGPVRSLQRRGVLD